MPTYFYDDPALTIPTVNWRFWREGNRRHESLILHDRYLVRGWYFPDSDSDWEWMVTVYDDAEKARQGALEVSIWLADENGFALIHPPRVYRTNFVALELTLTEHGESVNPNPTITYVAQSVLDYGEPL